MSSVLTIHLFETFRAERDTVSLSGLHLREGERLLAYFVLRNGEPVAARELARLFWPAEARMNPGGEGDFPCVRQALYSLRHALGPDAKRLTRPQRTTVQFDMTVIQTDVLAFDELVQMPTGEISSEEEMQNAQEAVERWTEAALLYRGALLREWDETWVKEARARRQRSYERILRRLIEHTHLQGEERERERWTRRLLAVCPTDEETCRDLLRQLSATGRHAEARETFNSLAETMQRMTGQALQPETLALERELQQERERNSLPLRSTPTELIPSKRDALLPVSHSAGQESRTKSRHSENEEPPEFAELPIEPAGGAVPVQSPFYIERGADAEFRTALMRGDSIVVVKGARQVGKTSLMARGLHHARQSGRRVVVVDFQKINEEQLASPDTLYLAMADSLAMQLDLATLPREEWNPAFGPNMNLERYLRRHLLNAFPEPLVWCLDEVDRLFTCPFSKEVFGLFRSWHNERALDPSCPWSRLTLALACATEVSLFITDINLSPFNVGTRLTLEDFTLSQVAELNRRYGGVLPDADIEGFHTLTGGHPYLVRRGLDEAQQGMTFARMEQEGDQPDGLFGEHLRRLFASLSSSPELLDVIREMLAGRSCVSLEAFYRLRTGGVIAGASPQEARFRCRLYASSLTRQLAAVPPIGQ